MINANYSNRKDKKRWAITEPEMGEAKAGVSKKAQAMFYMRPENIPPSPPQDPVPSRPKIGNEMEEFNNIMRAKRHRLSFKIWPFGVVQILQPEVL